MFPFSTAEVHSNVENELTAMDPNADFSDKQVGKRVVAADGTQLGSVTEVRNGTMYVEVDSDANPDTIDELGWGGVVNQPAHELRTQFIADITENVVRLSV